MTSSSLSGSSSGLLMLAVMYLSSFVSSRWLSMLSWLLLSRLSSVWESLSFWDLSSGSPGVALGSFPEPAVISPQGEVGCNGGMLFP